MASMISEWKYEWINMQHWWNDGDSDIQLESHCTVSSYLVKLLNGEWRGIHHGYCQNVLKQIHVIMVIKHACISTLIKEKSPPKLAITYMSFHMTPSSRDSKCPATCHINHWTHTYCHNNEIISCVLPSRQIFYFKSSIYNLQPTLYISQQHKTTGKNDRFLYLFNILQTEFFTRKTYVYVHGRNYTRLSTP
jgi:hypothetical protein